MPNPSDFATRGSHPVGVATLELARPQDPQRLFAVDVWYPAASEADGEAADHPFNRPHDAIVAAPAADGRFPLVGFSHGNSGLRRQSTFLTTHLASWGFVVVAPDHPGNTFFEMIQLQSEEDRKRVHFDARRHRPVELATAIDAVRAGGGRDWPEVEERVGVLGHSFGGWTALKMPAHDARVAAVCGLAPASEPFVGRKAFEPDELPFSCHALLVAGLDDVLVDLETSVRPLFERLGDASALVGVAEADHFHFCDGVELLHGMHFGNPRANQPRPTKAYADQLPEDRIHRLLRTIVTRYFHAALVEKRDDPAEPLSPSALRAVDPAAERIHR